MVALYLYPGSILKFYNSGHSHSGVLSSQLDNASRGMNGSSLHGAIASLWRRDRTRLKRYQP